MASCTRAGCTGTIEGGYCNECGFAERRSRRPRHRLPVPVSPWRPRSHGQHGARLRAWRVFGADRGRLLQRLWHGAPGAPAGPGRRRLGSSSDGRHRAAWREV